MRFSFDGKQYQIEFERQHTFRAEYDPILNVELQVKSKYPNTIARVYEVIDGAGGVIPGEILFREAKVGCWHKEKKGFSLEKGRQRALRMITKTIPVGMKPLLWKAYHERPRGQ